MNIAYSITAPENQTNVRVITINDSPATSLKLAKTELLPTLNSEQPVHVVIDYTPATLETETIVDLLRLRNELAENGHALHFIHRECQPELVLLKTALDQAFPHHHYLDSSQRKEFLASLTDTPNMRPIQSSWATRAAKIQESTQTACSL